MAPDDEAVSRLMSEAKVKKDEIKVDADVKP